jgi:hypothetical protein
VGNFSSGAGVFDAFASDHERIGSPSRATFLLFGVVRKPNRDANQVGFRFRSRASLGWRGGVRI